MQVQVERHNAVQRSDKDAGLDSLFDRGLLRFVQTNSWVFKDLGKASLLEWCPRSLQYELEEIKVSISSTLLPIERIFEIMKSNRTMMMITFLGW